MTSRTRPPTGAERRAAARARAERSARRRRHAGRAARAGAGLVVAGLIVGAVAAGWAYLHRPGPAGKLPPEQPLAAFRIVYQVTQPGAPASDEEHDVQRPFLGRYETRQGAQVTSGSLTNSQGTWLYLTSGTPGWASVGGTKARAAGDSHTGGGLAEALRQGLARVIGHKEVAGHGCTVIRTGGPVGNPVTKPTGTDHADICVDGFGVPLEEVWTINGKLARAKTAATYDTSPVFTAQTWDPSPQASDSSSLTAAGPKISDLTDTEQAQLAFSLEPPSGFTPAGGFTQVTSTQGTASGQAILHFVDGADLIDLIQGGTPGGAAPPKGRVVTVPGVGQVTVVADLTDVAVEERVAPGLFARLTGSDADELLAAAKGLRHRST